MVLCCIVLVGLELFGMILFGMYCACLCPIRYTVYAHMQDTLHHKMWRVGGFHKRDKIFGNFPLDRLTIYLVSTFIFSLLTFLNFTHLHYFRTFGLLLNGRLDKGAG